MKDVSDYSFFFCAGQWVSFSPDQEVRRLHLGRGQWEAPCTRTHKVLGSPPAGKRQAWGPTVIPVAFVGALA